MFSLIKKEASEILNLQLGQAEIEAFEEYAGLLEYWNRRMNLTGIKDSDGIRVKHFLDSLSCLLVMGDLSGKNVVDVGTGAGFPGLVLKIVRPEIGLILVESVGKKLEFCKRVCKQLGLRGVQFINERVEILGQNPDHREKYDWAVARSVSQLPTMIEYMLPLLSVGGHMLMQQGVSAPVDVAQSGYAMTLLGGEKREIRPVMLPGMLEQRYLVVIEKMIRTPEKYPRRVGIPAKRPLSNR